jgi:pimeloyl-ACP methyl ester carboxylesterase
VDEHGLAVGSAAADVCGVRRRPSDRPAGQRAILAGWIADARLRVVSGGGHLFLLERPAQIAALLARFLLQER